MTHIVRDVEKPGSKLHKKEVRNLEYFKREKFLLVESLTDCVNALHRRRCCLRCCRCCQIGFPSCKLGAAAIPSCHA